MELSEHGKGIPCRDLFFIKLNKRKPPTSEPRAFLLEVCDS